MATLNDWNAYINLLHEMALIEDDLRKYAGAKLTSFDDPEEHGRQWFAETLLWERFGVTL